MNERAAIVKEYRELKRKEQLRAACPYFFRQPWGDQVAFEKSPAQIRIITGGNRSGKTDEGVAEAIAHAIGCRSDGSRDNIRPPPNLIAIQVADFEKVSLVIMEKTKGYAAQGWIKHVRNGNSGQPAEVEWKNGSRWFLGSYFQVAEQKEGPSWDAVWFDEPPPRPMYMSFRRGLLDRKGKMWLSLTPRKCPWIKNDIWDRADGIRIARFNLDLLDNPYISAVEKQAYIDDMHPDERESRIHGRFDFLQGAVFSEFRNHIHVIPAHTPPDGCPIFMVMDPHDRRPSYIAWAYVDARDRIVIFDEWPNEPFWEIKSVRLSIRDYATTIRDKEGRLESRVYERIMDPNYGCSQSINGCTYAEEYDQFGYSFYVDINNDITLGHNRIHERLEYKKRDPSLLITDNCTNMIWAFESYSWIQKDMEEGKSREKPDETGKDQIDAVRYLLDFGPSYDMGQSGEHKGSFSPQELGGGYG